jgi:hypothetical protein
MNKLPLDGFEKVILIMIGSMIVWGIARVLILYLRCPI